MSAGSGAALLAVAVLAAACAGDEPAPYANPVFEPVLADPSVVRGEDGLYYAYGTEDDWGDGGGSRAVPVVRSADLVSWEHVGEAFEARPDWKAPAFVWAPDIQAFGDAYHLYYSLSVWGDADPGIGVATAGSPGGPFTDHGKLFTSTEIGVENSIDPYVHSEDGIPYLFWGSFHGIYGVALTADGLAVDGEKFQVAGDAFEAPYLVERDGAYWLFGSLGSCCEGEFSTYSVSVGRADALEGPYLDRDGTDLLDGQGTPVLQGGGRFTGPGHSAVVRDDAGTDWIVYHAIERDEPYLSSGANRRVLMIDPLRWDDGWPSVAGLAPSEDKQAGPHFDQEG